LAFALLLRLSRSKGYILFLIIHQLENEEKKNNKSNKKKQQKQTIFIQIKYSNINSLVQPATTLYLN
jgi:negative regulator of genetic competence, sporulation and motility